MKVESESNETASVRVRCSHSYEDLSCRFRLRVRSYDRQFNNLYSVRISEARSRIEKTVFEKWGKPVNRLMSLNEIKSECCVIVGTLYKQQELKPSILQDVSKEYQTVPPPSRTHFVSDKDELILEDETQRVTLSGKLDVNKVVTGCVVAVFGKLHQHGIFEVQDYCWAEVEPIAKPLPELKDDRFLLLISGIELATNKNSLLLQLFVDWVIGFSGISDAFIDTTKIVHVIFAGNCIRSKPQQKPKYGTIIDNSEDIEAVKELDYVIEQLIQCIDVDVMPGEFDPTTHTLPQQPLHKCLFPQSAQFSTFRSVSNPHICRIEDRIVLGTSGQPIEDIKRYSNLTDSLEILENTLDWAHMAPTAPDTLPCYPFDDYDPFIITEKPHIYFAGNQPEFQTKLKKGKGYDVRLICVPSFVQTQSFVVVNLKNLDSQVINFNIDKTE